METQAKHSCLSTNVGFTCPRAPTDCLDRYMLVHMKKCSQEDVDQVKEQFKQLDADGSGTLDKDDIAFLKAGNQPSMSRDASLNV